MSNALEEVIQKLTDAYQFITDEQIRLVRKEYGNSTKTIEEIEMELLAKIKDYAISLQKTEFNQLTDFVSYHLSNGAIHIHLIPKSLFPYMRDIIKEHGKEKAKNKFDEFLMTKLDEALTIAANMINLDESIKTVSATSELVKKYQSLFEKTGFSIRLFTDEQLAGIFPGKSKEEREAFRYNAYMDREKILEKYNNKLIDNSDEKLVEEKNK